MQTAAHITPGFERLPLSLTHCAVLVTAICARVKDGPAADIDAYFPCGFSALPKGHAAVLGVWSDRALEADRVHLVGDDLVDRGVEHVRLLLNGASEELGTGFLRAFPGASVALPFHPTAQLALSVALPRDRKAIAVGLDWLHRAQSQQHADAILDALVASTWQGAPAVVQVCRAAIRRWRAVYALPKRTRERVRRAEDAAWQLQQGVSRALARQSPFESVEAAAAFAEAWLFEAEGRARRRRLAADRRSGLAAAAAAV